MSSALGGAAVDEEPIQAHAAASATSHGEAAFEAESATAQSRWRWRAGRVLNPRVELMLSASTIRGFRLRRVLLISDVVSFAFALALATTLHQAISGSLDTAPLAIAILISAPAWFLIAQSAGLYHLSERHIDFSLAEEIGPTFMVTTVWLWLLLLTSSVLVSGPLSIMWFFFFWVGAITFVLFGRAVVRRATRDRDWYRQDVLVIGDDGGIARVLRRVLRHPECGLDVVGVLRRADGGTSVQPMGERPGSKRLGAMISRRGPLVRSPEEVASIAADAGIQRVIVTDWGDSLDHRTELIRILATSGLFVDMISGEPEALCSGASVHHLEGLPIMTVKPTSMTKTAQVIKRGIDIGVAGVGLLLLSPILAYTAIRIRSDSSGPALFRQKRAGQDGKDFEVVKFRTMIADAEGRRAALRPVSDQEGTLKLRDDPRVTRYGARLRRRSLDELPQLWNVLRGDMSLVGPRPLPLDEAPLALGHFADRLRVRPGMTGPWQIHGRSDIPFDDMVKLDYTYVSSWSLQEDLRLLIRTVGVVLAGRGAY